MATELQEHAYSRWLVRREDKIIAKGKGEMQTDWIVGAAAGSSGEGTDYEGSTTRHLGGDAMSDSFNHLALDDSIILADRDFVDQGRLDP